MLSYVKSGSLASPLTSTWPQIMRCDVGLEEGEYCKKSCLCVTVLCTVIMVYKGMSLQVGRLYRTFVMLGLVLCLLSVFVSSVFMVLYIYTVQKITCDHIFDDKLK